MFIYLSHENERNNWVYFDDFKVTHTKSRIVQYNEYYPFGMATQNSWTREGATGNNLPGIGGTEWNATSSFYNLDYRNYDPILGTMNLKPAVYAGGLEAENQIAMGLTVAINISLGILKKDYLGAFSMRNTQAGSQSVSQAGFLSDGTSSSLDLLIGSVAWRLGEDIDNSKGWFKGKAAWYEGRRLNNPTVNVRMPAPIPNFRISAQAALRMSTTLKVGGGILGVYGLYSTYDDFSSGKISGGEAALDAAFGVIGFFGPWVMVASATYFLVAKPLYKYATSDGN